MSRKPLIVLVLIFYAVVSLAVTQGVAAETHGARLALLITNAKYPNVAGPPGRLIDDGSALADELRQDGFATELKQNLTKQQMQAAINEFEAKIQPGSVALFFFSGIGIQVDRQNFMVPVDGEIWAEKDVRKEAISVDTVLSGIQHRDPAVKILVLDASWRNPFERRFREFSAGLAAVELPVGTLAISSTAVGKAIDIRIGDNGLFVGELVKQIRAPGQTAEQAFTRTRVGVSRASHDEQVPWVSSALLRDFYFRPSASAASSNPPAEPAAPAAPASSAEAPTASEVPVASASATPKPGELFRDCADCAEMVVVPSGEFQMGGNDTPFEKPAHKVTISSPFAIGRREVTFAEWDACVTATACQYRPDDHGFGRGDHPVIDISWDDAKTFVSWLSRKTGKTYRLPTEAEWEYAARAGTTSTFWWGREAGSGHANCQDCGPGSGQQTMATGSFRPNGFGLYDTAGNAAEWVEDCWNDSFRGAPRDGSAWTSGNCGLRVLRGGSFANKATSLRSAHRFRYDEDVRYYGNGFRVARDVP